MTEHDGPVNDSEREPADENGKLYQPDGAPHRERRLRALGLYVRHYLERKTLADCWFEVHPESKATSAVSAGNMASREIKWLIRTYPLDIDNKMEAHGLGEDDALERLRRLSARTMPLKVGVVRDMKEDANGRLVAVGERYVFEETEDSRTQLEALKLQLALLGHGSGATRRPLSQRGGNLNDVHTPMEELPKTIEEAKARGIPITLIEHAETLAPDEWQRQWDEYQEEIEEERRQKRANGAESCDSDDRSGAVASAAYHDGLPTRR